MQILDCSQGSVEWFAARLGIPTASRFADFVTPLGVARKGVGPRRYALELLGERLTRRPAQHFETDAMVRGTELEPHARDWYSFATGRDVQRVGFIRSDCGRWGCSPDGLMPDRGLEIKCPLLATFLDIAESRALPDDHAMQVQASMWITGLALWDYVVYTDAPGCVPQVVTVQRDATLHAAFDKIVPEFCAAVDAMEAKMRTAGHGILAAAPPAYDPFDPFADDPKQETT
jgi:hypothetical protein